MWFLIPSNRNAGSANTTMRETRQRSLDPKEGRVAGEGRERQQGFNRKSARDRTYDRSKGVAVCEPARLCAKLTFPPICLAAPGGTVALPPIGMPPPNPQPAPLPTGPASRVSRSRQSRDAKAPLAQRASSPGIFPFGNLLGTARPDCCCCCCCCWPPNPPGMPRSDCGTAPDVPRARQHISFT